MNLGGWEVRTLQNSWGEASEGLEPPDEALDVDEIAQVGSQLVERERRLDFLSVDLGSIGVPATDPCA